MFNIVSLETIEKRFTDHGYAHIQNRNVDHSILYKKIDGITKVIAIFSFRYSIKSIADVKAVTYSELCGSSAGDVKSEDILYVIQNAAGTSHHFIGKNVIFVDHNGQFVTSYFISSKFKEEHTLVKNYRKLNKNYNKQSKILHPEDWRHSKIALYVLIVLNILFLAGNMMDGTSLGYSVEKVIDGNWTSMFTYMFAHANIAHLIGNMSALLFVGSIIMEIEGVLGFSLIYFLGGFAAAFIDCILVTRGYGDVTTVTVGASGAIFALTGAVLVESFFDIAAEENRAQYIKFVILSLVLSNIGSRVNVKVHLAGFIIGVVVTLIYCLIKREINYKRLYTLRGKEEKYNDDKKNVSPVLSLKIEDDYDNGSYAVLNRLQKGRTTNYYC